jgi:hypothetical protein
VRVASSVDPASRSALLVPDLTVTQRILGIWKNTSGTKAISPVYTDVLASLHTDAIPAPSNTRAENVNQVMCLNGIGQKCICLMCHSVGGLCRMKHDSQTLRSGIKAQIAANIIAADVR